MTLRSTAALVLCALLSSVSVSVLSVSVLSVPVAGAAEPPASAPVPTGAPAAAAALSGRVLGPGGAPLAKAEVLLLPAGDPAAAAKQILAGATPSDRAVARVRTDARGAYTLEGVAPGVYWVRVSAEGFVPRGTISFSVVDDEDLPDVELASDEGLAVTVTAGGRPLAGVLVQARPADAGPRGVAAWSPAPQQAVTGPDGVARLARAGKGALDLAAGAPGFALAVKRGVRSSRVALALEPGAAAPVELRHADGTPAAGALLRHANPSFVIGLADAAGRLELRVPRAGEVKVEAAAASGATAEAAVTAAAAAQGKTPAPQRITLAPMTSVAGRVINAASRAPVAGALVSTPDRRTAVTDDAGAFTIALPARGRQTLAAVARGYLLDDLRVVPGIPPTFALKPAARVEGRVVDRAARPVAGAQVVLAPAEAAGDVVRISFSFGGTGRLGPRATTRADGSFRIAGIDPEPPYDLKVAARGFAPGTREIGALNPAEPLTGVVVELAEGIAATGVVVDGAGRPVPGADVVFRPSPKAAGGMMRIGGPPAPPAGTAASDSEGRFAVADLEPGAYDVGATRAGYAPTTVPRVEIGAATTDTGRIVLEPGITFDGLVVDAAGKPVEGVSITALAGGDPLAFAARLFGGNNEPDAVTGPDGRFVIRDRRRGERVDLLARREGYGEGGVPGLVVPPDAPLKITLTAASRIGGRVLDPEGRPVPGASVLLRRDRRAGGGGMMFMFQSVSGAETDESGAFELEDVPPGGVSLTVQASGYQDQEVPGLTVVAGKDLTGLEVRLAASAWVEGRVLLPDGTPAVGASIGPVRDESAPRGMRSFAAAADGDGRFRLDGLKPGLQSVEANRDNLPRVVRDLELRPGVNAADFQFTGGVDVSGRVVDAAGAPVARATVQLEQGARSWGGPETMTDANGEFTFRNVMDGEFRAVAQRSGHASSEPATVKVAGAAVGGVLLQLRTPSAIVGTVRGVEPSALAGISVRAFGQDAVGMVSTSPDAQGRYRLENAGPGTWHVSAQDRDGGTATAEVTIEAGQAEATADLDFGKGFTVTGRVVVGTEPVVDAFVFASGRAFTQARTDSEGRFRLRGVEAGPLEISVNDFTRGLRHTEKLEVKGDRDVVLRVPTMRVAGRVLDAADRSPLAGVSVALARTDAAEGEGGVFLRPAVSADAAGRFELANVAPGTYRVDARKPGYAVRDATITVAEGQDLSRVEVLLDATEGMTLVVLQPSGQPVNGEVSVSVLDASGRVIAGGHPATGESGRLRVSGVPAGTWEVLASTDGTATTRVSASAPGGAHTVALQPACTLQVEVPALADATAEDVKLTLTGADGRPFRSVAYAWRDPVPEIPVFRGKARLDDVPPGAWTLRVTAPGGKTYTGTATTTPGAPAKVVLD